MTKDERRTTKGLRRYLSSLVFRHSSVRRDAMARSIARTLPRGWLAKESQREALAGYLFILPTFLGYTTFVIGPILAAIGISLTSYDMLSAPKLVGLAN